MLSLVSSHFTLMTASASQRRAEAFAGLWWVYSAVRPQVYFAARPRQSAQPTQKTHLITRTQEARPHPNLFCKDQWRVSVAWLVTTNQN